MQPVSYVISAMSVGSFFYAAGKETIYSHGNASKSLETEEAKEHADLLKKENIRSDFSIRYSVCIGSNQTMGINYPTLSDATIYMWPGIKEADIHAYHFLLLRQFYYLKNNVGASTFFKSGCLGLGGYAIVYLSINSPWLACGSAIVISQIAEIIQYNGSIEKADDFAIQHASDKQLEGGLRYLKALKKMRLIHAKKQRMSEALAEKMADGSYSLSCQPRLTDRMAKITTELIEKRKIKTLKNFETENVINLLANAIQNCLQGREHRSFDLI